MYHMSESWTDLRTSSRPWSWIGRGIFLHYIHAVLVCGMLGIFSLGTVRTASMNYAARKLAFCAKYCNNNHRFLVVIRLTKADIFNILTNTVCLFDMHLQDTAV